LFKLTSLNLNGIRSASRKGLESWVANTSPDCMCVQELKAQVADMAGSLDVIAALPGYFHTAEKKGYSGVGIYTKRTPSEVISGFGNEEFDAEGRYIELRFDSPKRKFSVISSYFPSGSSGDERQNAKFRFLDAITPHLRALAKSRDYVLCGDLNIAHQNIDLKNWRSNQKNSGFTPEERAWMTAFLEGGMIDVYRQLHPTETDAAYTWWSNRGQAWANNVGWRLDYHLATPAFAALARHCAVYKTERFSDHAPITIDYAYAF
jgi:exodeoxyribonuclease-3